MSKNIEIYIDRIVLDGFDHLNKVRLHAAVQEQLQAIIFHQGLPDGLTRSRYHRKLDGGEMDLTSRPKTMQIGNDIAGGIFNGINNVS